MFGTPPSRVDRPRRPGVLGPRERVLVVDDEPAVLRGLIRNLKDRYAVDTADSAEHALLLLAAAEYRAVVTDYDLPGQDGIWLLEFVERRYPRVRRVLHSGSDPVEVDGYVKRGVVQTFLQKPAHLGALESAV